MKESKENGFENITPIQIDVTDPDAILSAKKIIESEQGKLDILINNAGISKGFPESALTTSIKDIREVFDTNYFRTISVTQIFLELEGDILQYRQKGKSLLLVTSILELVTCHQLPIIWCFKGFRCQT